MHPVRAAQPAHRPAPLRRPWRRAMPLAATAAVALFAAPAPAGPNAPGAKPALADPTRPAAGFAPVPDGTRTASLVPVARLGAKSAASAPAAAPPPAPPVVQSIHLPQSGPPSALVDGRLVQPGDRIGDALLIGIDPDGLLLRGPNGGPLRLWLLEGVRLAPAGTDSRGTKVAAQPSPGPVAARTPAGPTASATAPTAAEPAAPLAIAGVAR